MKKFLCAALACAFVLSLAGLYGCSKKADEGWKKNKKYDLSVPQLNKDGWYLVFEDDFNGNSLNEGIKFGEKYTGSKEIWTTSPHAIRWQSDRESKPEQACWWCPEMVEVKDSNVIIHSRYEENHTCDGDCPSAGRVLPAELKQGVLTAIIITIKEHRISSCFHRPSVILNVVQRCPIPTDSGLPFGFSLPICARWEIRARTERKLIFTKVLFAEVNAQKWGMLYYGTATAKTENALPI